MHYRSIFISDIHLGTKSSQAEEVTAFLKQNTCDNLYLIGDIIDGWRIKSKFVWPQEHTNTIRKILTKSKRGANVVYVTGNHDEFLRNYTNFDLNIGNITIVDRYIHEGVDGAKYLIIHGDEFDGVTLHHRWVTMLGDAAYEFLLSFNRYYNGIRRKLGLGYWSVSAYLKSKTKKALDFIYKFEDNIIKEVTKENLDGAICGHIHTLKMIENNNKIYMNTSDWVETCGGIVENIDGTFHTFIWNREQKCITLIDHYDIVTNEIRSA